jgi:hypothetical protein
MIAWTSGIAQFTVRTPQNSQKRNNNNTKLLQQIKFKIEKKRVTTIWYTQVFGGENFC